MARLVKLETCAMDLEEVVAVRGTVVYLRDGRTVMVGRKDAGTILAAIPEWGGSIRAVRTPPPPPPASVEKRP